MDLAIFDLDNTLLAGDSDYAWGQFLIEKKVVNGVDYKQANERYYEQYRKGTLDIFQFLEFALQPLTRHERSTLEKWHQEFMQEKIRPMITEKARELVEQHRTRNDLLMIITATNSFVTQPIAKEFGIETLLATNPEESNGRFTGKVSGIPCFREGKVQRLQAWLQNRGNEINESWFYSDSHNDLPLLEIVNHPVAVDPDDILRKHARSADWPIISLR